jgi:hypothetical protein
LVIAELVEACWLVLELTASVPVRIRVVVVFSLKLFEVLGL